MMMDSLKYFQIEGKIQKLEPVGNGHINRSWHCVNADAQAPDYFLQQINHHVFPNIPALTSNVVRAAFRLIESQEKSSNPGKAAKFPRPVATWDKQYYAVDGQGSYWRMFTFTKNARSYDRTDFEDIAMEGGKAVGQFQKYMLGLNPKGFHEPIPDFHNLIFRLNNFDTALANADESRKEEAAHNITFVHQRRKEMEAYFQELGSGDIPLRITHNDTKFNNILFDEHDFSLCMIDLDTVMPGYVHYDFGDAIRVLCNTADEDEKDTRKISFRMDLFRSFCFGYKIYAGNFLTKKEKALLHFSPFLMTFIMGLRFLTDFLENDRYYKTAYPGHNLVRSKAQFAFIAAMDKVRDEMESCTKSYF